MSETLTGSVTDFRDMGEQAQLDALAALLGDGEIPSTGPDEPEEEDALVEGAAPPEGDQPEATEDEAEPPETASIEPPAFWSKDAKEHWAAIPVETQKYLSEREVQRDTEVRRVQNETAEARKQAEAIASVAAQERNYLAQHLLPAIQTITAKLQTDYSPETMADLAQKQPALWAQRMAEREQLQMQGQMMEQERQRQAAIVQQQEANMLVAKVPEWRDPKVFRAAGDQLRSIGAEFGFQNGELDSYLDHRGLLVLNEIAQLRAKLAATQSPASKKVAQPVAPRTLVARQRTDGNGQFARSQENIRAIARSGDAAKIEASLAGLITKAGW